MTQASALKVLERRKEWMATGEIAKILKINKRAAVRSLGKLSDSKDILKDSKKQGPFKTDFKWKARLN